jgi:hypothetical protein
MTKKDVTVLLAPIVMFVAIGLTALFMASIVHRESALGVDQQKLDKFTQNVQSGKLQLSSNQWLDLVHQQQTVTTDILKADENLHDCMLLLSCAAFLGIVWQVLAVNKIRNKMRR